MRNLEVLEKRIERLERMSWDQDSLVERLIRVKRTAFSLKSSISRLARDYRHLSEIYSNKYKPLIEISKSKNREIGALEKCLVEIEVKSEVNRRRLLSLVDKHESTAEIMKELELEVMTELGLIEEQE